MMIEICIKDINPKNQNSSLLFRKFLEDSIIDDKVDRIIFYVLKSSL